MFLSKIAVIFLFAMIGLSFAAIIDRGIPSIHRGQKIRTFHGKYIRAYPGENARVDQSDTASDWETFTITYLGDDLYIETFHGTYITVDEYGNVKTKIGMGDARFKRIYGSEGYALQTQYGMYLCAEEGHNALIKGDRTVIDTWEQFNIF